jgi:hypothetical protein
VYFFAMLTAPSKCYFITFPCVSTLHFYHTTPGGFLVSKDSFPGVVQ